MQFILRHFLALGVIKLILFGSFSNRQVDHSGALHFGGAPLCFTQGTNSG